MQPPPSKGRFFWFVRDALIHCCLRRNMPKACPYVMIRQCVESRKDENETIVRTGIGDAASCETPCKCPCGKDTQLGDSNARNNMSLGEGRSWYRPLLLPLLSGWAWRDKKKKWQELLLLPLSGVQDETRTHTNHCSLPPQSSASTNSATSPTFRCHFEHQCPRQDSNLHVVKHTHLKRARLPIPPPGL